MPQNTQRKLAMISEETEVVLNHAIYECNRNLKARSTYILSIQF